MRTTHRGNPTALDLVEYQNLCSSVHLRPLQLICRELPDSLQKLKWRKEEKSAVSLCWKKLEWRWVLDNLLMIYGLVDRGVQLEDDTYLMFAFQ